MAPTAEKLNTPCKVKNKIHSSVVVLTLFSRNLSTKQTFATRANAMDTAIAASNSAGFGFVSTVSLFSVRMYHLSVKPGISRRIENGITTPEMIGVHR